MAYSLRKRWLSVLTAATLSLSCFPIGAASLPASAAGSGADALNGQCSSTEKDDFSNLAFLALEAYSFSCAGIETDLSDTNRSLLDADESGDISMDDSMKFLQWSSYLAANKSHAPEAEQFLQKWNTTTTTEVSEETTETTESTTVTEETTTTTEETTTSEETTTTSETTTEETTTTETTTEEVTTTTTEALTTAAEATTETTAVTSAAETTTEAATTTTESTTTPESATTSATTTTKMTTAKTTTTPVVTTTEGVGAWANKDLYRGIDVSMYQQNVDWKAVKNSGVDYAIIRAGYGRYASQEDPYFDQNMRNAKAAGLACGAYWFSYADSVAAAKQEAEVFLQVIDGYQFEYPLVFDIEDQVHVNMTKEQVSAIIEAFCQTVEAKGYYISVYSYASFLNTKVYQSVLDRYDIWVAHFNTSAPAYSLSSYGMWQYSSTGSVPGIAGDVDLDYGYYRYPNIMSQAHLNGF